jgi:hypothetical protein
MSLLITNRRLQVLDLRAPLRFITPNKTRMKFYNMNIVLGFQLSRTRNKNKAGLMIIHWGCKK